MEEQNQGQVPNIEPIVPETLGSKKPNLKLIIPIIIVVLLLAGGAAAFFTDLRYKLPFFGPDKSELVAMMYQNLSELDGVDFSVNYNVNVGDRDADAPEPEAKDEEEPDEELLDDPTNNLLGGITFDNIWEPFEQMIPEDFRAEITFSGSGFSFSQREEGKTALPDVALGLAGSGKFGSMTMSVDMEGRAVGDAFYYKVSEFPMMDITKGHLGEWIKASADSGYVAEIVPEYDDKQKEVVDNFRQFIAQTQEHEVLEFIPTSNKMEVDGQKVVIFDLKINAANIPTWMEAARQLALESSEESDIPFFKTNEEPLSDEDKEEMVTKINKALRNIKIEAGLHRSSGQLMHLKVAARMIPPAESIKFADKQFNSILTLKLWNHNGPSRVEAPENFVDQEDIEQEELGLDDEDYNDYKQAQRIVGIRSKLAKYYKEHKEFPMDLSEVTRLGVDRNTGEDYEYSVLANNYELVYIMNSATKEQEENDDGPYGIDDLNLGMRMSETSLGYDNVFAWDYRWHRGANTADRFSPIADGYKKSNTHITDKDSQYVDQDARLAYYQSVIIKSTKEALDRFFKAENKYPDKLEDLGDNSSSRYYYNSSWVNGYVCEDIINNTDCDYMVSDDGQSYQLKADFSMDASDATVKFNSFRSMDGFVKGENTFIKGDEYDYDPPDWLLEEIAENYTAPVSDNDWIRGDKNAAVTIVEFSDIDCPFCSRFHTTMKQVIEDYDGQVNWVFRHFPLTSLHPEAFKKAEAAECVGELGGNGKFWEFLDLLFENSSEKVADLPDIVGNIGIDVDDFQTCLDSGRHANKVRDHATQAQTAGGRGTPYSVIISGDQTTPISGALPLESVKSLLDTVLQ